MQVRTFNLFTAAALLGILSWIPTSKAAEDTPNSTSAKEQVVSFVNLAKEHIKAYGKNEAFKEFNNSKGAFVKGPAYIFAIDYKGNMLANGGEPSIVGSNRYDMQDPKGNYAIRDLIAKGKQGGGWVSYYWNNPITQKIGCKSSYVLPIQDEFVIGSGYYHEANEKGECTVAK